MSPNICGCDCWRKILGARGVPIFAASVMTTSPSMAGAAQRSIISCALKRTSPARKSFAWSAITDRRSLSSLPRQPSSRIIRAASAKRCSLAATGLATRTPRRSRYAASGMVKLKLAWSAMRSKPGPRAAARTGMRIVPSSSAPPGRCACLKSG